VVSHLKYTKSKRQLELTVSLGYDEVKSANDDQLIEVVKKGLLMSYDAVASVHIKDFDIDAFYRDLEELLTDREWLKHPDKYKKPPFVYRPEGQKADIPEELKMDQDSFWNLIEESLAAGGGDIAGQIEFLISKLSAMSEEEIIGFELTLRELIRRGYDYGVVGLLKAIDGRVTDDTLLYFRCRLILYGKEIFYTVLRNPNFLTQKLDSDGQAEHLLGVANMAFIAKFGPDTDKDLPTDIGGEYVEYDSDEYDMMGIPWEPKEFKERFARLLRLYK
jgi:hypothetical protein